MLGTSHGDHVCGTNQALATNPNGPSATTRGVDPLDAHQIGIASGSYCRGASVRSPHAFPVTGPCRTPRVWPLAERKSLFKGWAKTSGLATPLPHDHGAVWHSTTATQGIVGRAWSAIKTPVECTLPASHPRTKQATRQRLYVRYKKRLFMVRGESYG